MHKNIHRITLITTSQPSSNPRLVKEADALAEAGYKVLVLYCYHNTWASKLDQVSLLLKSWHYKLIGGTPNGPQRYLYQWTRFRRRLAEIFSCFTKGDNARSLTRAYDELLQAAIQSKADLFIAHNPGALPIAAKAAMANNSCYAFDAEDFHTGELDSSHFKTLQIERQEQLYLKNASYISAASPLISHYYNNKYGISLVTINNVFPLSLQPCFRTSNLAFKLRLFWFSQTIGRDRGIEDTLISLSNLYDIPIEIGLLGNITNDLRSHFENYIKSPLHNIIFYAPRSENELVKLCSEYDIGLALERSYPINRDICLTNKIFIYLLAGNAIIASKTTAQEIFINEHSTGFLFSPGDTAQLSGIIKEYYKNPELLNAQRAHNWNLAKTKLNWDNEKNILLNTIKNV